jgi:hypothetical protein
MSEGGDERAVVKLKRFRGAAQRFASDEKQRLGKMRRLSEYAERCKKQSRLSAFFKQPTTGALPPMAAQPSPDVAIGAPLAPSTPESVAAVEAQVVAEAFKHGADRAEFSTLGSTLIITKSNADGKRKTVDATPPITTTVDASDDDSDDDIDADDADDVEIGKEAVEIRHVR